MAFGARYPDTGTLPDVLPIFPLPGAMLLPGGQLPLASMEKDAPDGNVDGAIVMVVHLHPSSLPQ